MFCSFYNNIINEILLPQVFNIQFWSIRMDQRLGTHTYSILVGPISWISKGWWLKHRGVRWFKHRTIRWLKQRGVWWLKRRGIRWLKHRSIWWLKHRNVWWWKKGVLTPWPEATYAGGPALSHSAILVLGILSRKRGAPQRLYSFFVASTHHWKLLNDQLSTKSLPTVKRMSDTRWSARADDTKALVMGYIEINAALEEIADDVEQKADTRQVARGLASYMNRLETGILAWTQSMQPLLPRS